MKNLTREEASRRAAILAVASYDVTLDLTDDDGFDSTSEIRFAAQAGESTFVELDARARRVELNGRELDPATQVGNRIPLDDLAADNVLRVTADCSYTNTGEGLHRFVDPADGETYLYAQSFLDDAQRMFACFDQPDLKATFSLTVASRPGWTVIGNERGTRHDGGRWTFATTQRMSTYLVTVAAGPWSGQQTIHDGIELGVWCRRSLGEHLDADELFTITRTCFDYQHEVFGRRYPFGDTYDQVFVPEFNAGAMENPGAVTFSEDFLFRSKVTAGRRRTRAMVIAHEMSHMWFGDLVTMRWWDDLWLNESFAELMGFHTVDRTGLYADAWADFSTSRKAWGYRADAMPTTHPVAGEAADSRSALLNFDGISYAKGASVLRQLMAVLTEDVFFAGVRAYFERHAFSNTTLADLLAELEQASGRDLQEWSEAWLRTAGTSTLRPIAGRIVQESPGPDQVLREHRLVVAAFDLADERLVRRGQAEVHLSGESTELPDLGGPADLMLVNDGDLTFAKTRFDARSLATVTGHLATLDEPLARALVWGSLWDATRDADLPPGVYVDAVVANVRAESDPGILATLLEKATTAAVRFSTPERVALRLAAVSDLAWAHVQSAAPGSDLQLAWTTAAIAASGLQDQSRLTSLLVGRSVPDGLVVDAELRWLVVRRLAGLGALSAADIDAELDRDRTSAGERHADYAYAARPDAAAKESAWVTLTTDVHLSNHRAEALAQGYWQPGQDELLDGSVEAYFAVAVDLWETRSPQLAETLAGLLFPTTIVHAYLLDRTDRFLAAPLPDGLRRVVLEAHDDLRRALASQALDS